MNTKSISFYLSLFCFPISILSFINILYSSYFDYFLNVEGYFTSLIVSFVSGVTLYFLGKNSNKKLTFYEQIILIILTYILISVLVAIPYFLSIYQISFIDSLFESFSGLTVTGFSIFNNIKQIDPALLLWRSSSQWIGGLFFFIFLIVLFSNKQFSFKLNNLTFSGDVNNTESSIKDNILKIAVCYSIVSVVIFFLLLFAEIRLFNSLNLSMSLVSTGGFLPTNSLSQIIYNPKQELFLIICLLISSLNLFFLFNLFNFKKLHNYHREDFFLIITILFFIIIFSIFIKELNLNHVIISILSSIGNSGIAITKMPEYTTLFFLILSIIGGSIISNTSGIKLIRVYILLKSLSAEILKLVRPNNIINQNILYSETKITNEYLKISFLIFISFFISLFILSGVLIFDNLSFETSFKLSILTLTNTTNSDLFGLNNINFSSLLTSSKISLILFMIVGKIELISIFLLLKKYLLTN